MFILKQHFKKRFNKSGFCGKVDTFAKNVKYKCGLHPKQ